MIHYEMAFSFIQYLEIKHKYFSFFNNTYKRRRKNRRWVQFTDKFLMILMFEKKNNTLNHGQMFKYFCNAGKKTQKNEFFCLANEIIHEKYCSSVFIAGL